MGQSASSSEKKVSKIDGQAMKARAKAAILGAFVADAATMPLHGIYDQLLLEKLMKDKRTREKNGTIGPEFYAPPQSPLYSYPVGRHTPYGDEAIPVIHSLSTKGFFDLEHTRDEVFQFYQSYKGRLNRGSLKFLELRKQGLPWDECVQIDDNQFLSVTKVPLIVARYAGSPMLLSKVEEAVRIQQASDSVIAATRLAARLLEKVILGSTVIEALQSVKTSSEGISSEEAEYIDDLERRIGGARPSFFPFNVAAEKIGLSAQLPESLSTSLYALSCFRSYEVAIRANISAGGDNACRSWLIGAMLAAEGGESCIPLEWKNKTLLYPEILSLANRLVGSNPHFDSMRERGCKMPSFATITEKPS